MLNIKQIRTKLETSTADTGKNPVSAMIQAFTSDGINGGADEISRHTETKYLRVWQDDLMGQTGCVSLERKSQAVEKSVCVIPLAREHVEMGHQTWQFGGNRLAAVYSISDKTCSHDLFMGVLLIKACLSIDELVAVMASRLYLV
jgi:hypothetical protein